MADDELCRVWVGNLPDKIDEELLFELFLQAGPVEDISLPRHANGQSKSFAFVTFKHERSTQYAKSLLSTTRLFGRELNIRPKAHDGFDNQEEKIEMMPTVSSRNALRGFKGRDGLNSWQSLKEESNVFPDQETINRRQNMMPAVMPDFNTLLQLGQQLQHFNGPMAMGGPLYPSQQSLSLPQERRLSHNHGHDRDRGHHRHDNRSNPYRDERSDRNRHGQSSDRRYQSGRNPQQSTYSGGYHSNRDRKGRR